MSPTDRNISAISKIDISKAFPALQADPQQTLKLLQQRPGIVLSKIDDGGTRIIIKPNPWGIWILIGIVFASSTLLALMALADDRDWFSLGFHFQTMKLYMISGGGLIGVFILIVVRLASGPPKDTIIEVQPGRLKIEYYVSGDRIFKHVAASDIRDIHVNNGLNVDFRGGSLMVAPFVSEKTLELVAQLIGQTLSQK